MKCKRNDTVVLSDSPRYQCKRCGQLWFVGSSPPGCHAYVSIKKKPSIDNKVKSYLERADKLSESCMPKGVNRNPIDIYTQNIEIAKMIQLEEK